MAFSLLLNLVKIINTFIIIRFFDRINKQFIMLIFSLYLALNKSKFLPYVKFLKSKILFLMYSTYSSNLVDDLSDVDLSNLTPYPSKLFSHLNDDQRQIFEKLLNKKRGESFVIENELSGIIKPFKGLLQKKFTYREILKKIANHYKIPISGTDVKKIEEEILVYKFQENFQKLSPEDKRRFQQELNKVLEKKNLEGSQLASLGSVGALALAEISGMGIYIVASTFVGGLTSVLGITLPFAFYTGMSSFLAFVTGPVGWAVGIGALAYSLRNDNFDSITNKFKATLNASKSLVKGNYELASIIVVQICANRIILNQEKTKEIEELKMRMTQEKERKKQFSSKAEMVEMQLKRILEEKKDLDQELQSLSNSIKNSQDSINKLKSQMI
ncbi:hypothetical protein LB467_14435 [Salegentibacter sp. JZCK2]|uniref:hypothetical protein n=1 Tax=Salegentibacter tibetensis TaxID=2873600 RepID=UPI001CCA59A9|nr:hypothetical protein [Salegentibacter tibetensis]MBZ9730890.1 hypothetical protein [Salegentibacter tibetensis]